MFFELICLFTLVNEGSFTKRKGDMIMNPQALKDAALIRSGTGNTGMYSRLLWQSKEHGNLACFIRDSAGAMKLHTAAVVQYFRPEIVGFVCGSFLVALATREYRSTAGRLPCCAFILGVIMMIGSWHFWDVRCAW